MMNAWWPCRCRSIDPDDLGVAFMYAWSCKRTSNAEFVPYEDDAYTPGGSVQCFSDSSGKMVAGDETLVFEPSLLQVMRA